ncbi:uncharacterized protein E0L32_003879 [Thyridium curvatum]|uniref:CENP-V/GFA domain-containing protein n=1 Tax=Thyridium curvatum TaxID=1093900 RepID=A0A507B0G0_9PEZI|nr:uncharacterized protein E0L32_003879 [Thyridium curvatum]TPX16585.1 hypothetical protein E0L32_003879 [Thyridium curvatum]
MFGYFRPPTTCTPDQKRKFNVPDAHDGHESRGDSSGTTAQQQQQQQHYSRRPSLFPLEGGCACGRVRYRLERPPLIVHCCHCTACQRETGSAFAVNAMTERRYLTRLGPASVPAATAAGQAPPRASGDDDDDDDDGLRSYAVPAPSGGGTTAVRQGCASCGVGLFGYHDGHHRGTAPDDVVVAFVRVGTLDLPGREALAPDAHVWTRSRLDFVQVGGDGRPQYDEFYEDWREVFRPDSVERFEALDEAVRGRAGSAMRAAAAAAAAPASTSSSAGGGAAGRGCR